MRLTVVSCLLLSSSGPACAFVPHRTPVSSSTRTSDGSKQALLLSATNSISIDEGTPRDIGSMDEWATMCQVQRVEGFQLSPNDESGLDWSVYTNQDIAANSPVLFVPSNMILSSTRLRHELGDPVLNESIEYLSRLGMGDQVPQFILFVKLLLEYQQGDQSPYFPWLNSLPRLYYNAVSMTNFCYECLPPLVFSLARMDRVKFDNFFDAVQKISALSQETKEDKELCKWAFNTVYTRSLGDSTEQKITPMADMFNHGTDTEVEVSFDEEGNCNVYTTRDVPAGSPLRMSYGDPTNPSRLFATYGFLDETSPATFCKIMSIQPTPELRDIGFDFSRMLFYKDTGDISEEVWDVMLYQNLSVDQAEQQAFYNAHMSGDAVTKQAIHQKHFLQTSTALKNHVDGFLTQLDELSAKGVGKDVNEHPRLPLILQHNEFVKSTFLTVKARLDPMVAEAAGEPVYA